MSGDTEALGAWLGACRRLAGLSQEELAERSGLGIRAVSNLERGRTRRPHPDSVLRLADALGLSGEQREEFIAAGRRLARVADAALSTTDVPSVTAETGATVRFGVLGPLQVVDGAGASRTVPAAKQRILLAALLLATGGTVSAASLAEALWDASPPPNAPAVMRTYVMRLRRALGPAGGRIMGRPPGWAIELHGPEEFDVAEVDYLWRAARAAAAAGKWREVSSLLARALSLWRGEPLVDVPSAALARREAERLAELRLQLTEARIDADLRAGMHGDLVAELRRLAAEHPFREHIRAQLMLACYRSGHQAAALEVYRDARKRLADELGVEPGRELQEMHQKILTADPGLTAALGPVQAVTGRQSAGPAQFADTTAEPTVLTGSLDDLDDAGGMAVILPTRRRHGSPGESHSKFEPRDLRRGAMVQGPGEPEPPGSWVQRQREAAGLTQEDLGERSGLAVRTIRNLERDRTRRTRAESIHRVAGVLGLSGTAAEELITRYRVSRGTGSGRSRPGDAGTDGPSAASPGEGKGRQGCAAVTMPWQVPAPPRHFAGRRSELESLTSLLEQTGDTAGGVVIGAISGMAGVGKTALAMYWAHQVARRFPDGQLYVNLRGFDPSGSPVEPAVALHGFLDGLGVAAGQIPGSLEAQASLYRSLLAGRRILILLDNARDVEQVRPLLPGSPRCLVLVTSRARLAGLAVGEHAELLALDVLSEDEARQFLAARLGAGRVAGEPDAVSELIALCARLPLALAIVAARAAAHPRFPLADLSAELRDAGRRLDSLDAGEAASSIRAVLSCSYQQLAEPAARMLRLLAVHHGPDITAAAAASTAGVTLRQARCTMHDLAAANLATEHAPGRYALHELLRAFACEKAQADGHAGDQHAAIRRMLDHYLHTATTADLMTSWERDPITPAAPQPGVTPETLASRGEALAWLDAERAVLVEAVGHAAETGFDVHAWQLAWSLAVFLQLRGHGKDLVTTQRIALAAARRLDDQNAQARIHIELSCAHAHSGCPEAEAHLTQALTLYQRLGDQEGQARARIIAGVLLSQQGRRREALAATIGALHPPAADTRDTQRAVTPFTRALACNNLGWVHAQLGELDHARPNCQHALELFRKIGSRHGQAAALDSLGYISHRAGDHDQAAAHYRLAAEQYRQTGNRYELAATLTRLGDTCQAAADIAAARDAWQQALHILDNMQHPDADRTRANLHRLGGMNGRPR